MVHPPARSCYPRAESLYRTHVLLGVVRQEHSKTALPLPEARHPTAWRRQRVAANGAPPRNAEWPRSPCLERICDPGAQSARFCGNASNQPTGQAIDQIGGCARSGEGTVNYGAWSHCADRACQARSLLRLACLKGQHCRRGCRGRAIRVTFQAWSLLFLHAAASAPVRFRAFFASNLRGRSAGT
jgi:hypothetical protein